MSARSLAKRFDLPPHYVEFIKEYARSGNVALAATKAGVSIDTGYYILRHNSAQAALHNETKRLVMQAAPMAVRRMIHLVENATSEKVQLDASKEIVHLSGIVVPRALPVVDVAQQTLTEMSIDELKDLAGKLEHELSERATVVSAPPSQDERMQPIDLLE